MKKYLSLCSLLVVVLFATSVFASGVALTGVGARATALGGNFRGIANDWSAMFWNPAGIAQLKGMHAGFSFELVMPEAKYTLTQFTPPFGVYNTSEFKNEPRTFPIPAIGFVYGMEKMSFGLSVFAPFGLGAKWDAMNTAAYNSAYPEFDFEDDLQVIDIHPTFAYQVSEKLSVGVGVSIVMGDILIRKPTTTPNPAAVSTFIPTVNTYNHILTETKLEGDGMGFGANFGIKYDLTECLSLGFSGTWYNDVSLDGKISAATYYPKLDATTAAQLTGTLDYLISVGQLNEATKQGILAVYNGQKVTVYDNAKGDAKLPLPMTIGAGIAYTGIDKLLVSADVSWTQWSAWDVIEIEMEDGSTSELVENWEDGIRLGLGLEYSVMEAMKLRAGYYTEPTAIPDETLTITIPDINRRHAITVGASYCLGPVSLFASYENIMIGDRTVDDWVQSADKTSFENMAGDYKMTVNNIMFGLGYKF